MNTTHYLPLARRRGRPVRDVAPGPRQWCATCGDVRVLVPTCCGAPTRRISWISSLVIKALREDRPTCPTWNGSAVELSELPDAIRDELPMELILIIEELCLPTQRVPPQSSKGVRHLMHREGGDTRSVFRTESSDDRDRARAGAHRRAWFGPIAERRQP